MAHMSPPETQRPFEQEIWALLPALLVGVVVLVFGVAGTYAPPAEGEMAIVFAPGTSEASAYGAIVGAGGRIVGSSRFGNIVVAYASDTGFRDRIGAHGGLFTLAATGLCRPVDTAALGDQV